MNEWCRRGRKKNSILVAALISTVTERCWHLCISLLQRRGRARGTCTRVRREGWGTSAEIISAFCQKAKRRIGYLRKGISPRCKLWIKQQNILGCHTLEPLTFLYLTVEKRKKNPFSHLFSALVFAITMFQSCLVPTVTRNTQKDWQSFFLCSNYLRYLFETKSLV